MPEGVWLVRGIPRPYSMMYGIDESFNAALFIGYHAKFCTRGAVLDHTYSGTYVKRLKINGVETSEFYINALVAGHYNVPVILVAGDDKLALDVKEKAPWIEYVTFKKSITRYSTITVSLSDALKMLENGIKKAVSKLLKGEVKALKVDEPVEIEITFPNSGHADVVEYIPGSIRVDGCTVKYIAKNIIEAYKFLQASVYLASAVDSMFNTLMR